MKFLSMLAGLGLCFALIAFFQAKSLFQAKAELVQYECDVREIAKIYYKYQRDHGQPPQSQEDLAPLIEKTASTTRERVKNGEFVFDWGTRIDPSELEASTRLVILAKPIVQGNQIAVLQDGKVRRLSPDEVKGLLARLRSK